MTAIIYDIPEACAVGRTGRTTLYEAIRSGKLRAVKRGRRTLILADDLRDWLKGLPAFAPVPPSQNLSTQTDASATTRSGVHGYLQPAAKRANTSPGSN
jgi:excisionase family DNA binding protein